MLPFLYDRTRLIHGRSVFARVHEQFPHLTYVAEEFGGRVAYSLNCKCIDVSQIPDYNEIVDSEERVDLNTLGKLIRYVTEFKDDRTKFPNNKCIKNDQFTFLMMLRQKIDANGVLTVKRVRNEFGRFYGTSLSSLSSSLRSTLFQKLNYVDLDQRKSGESIFVALAALCGVHTPCMIDWINDPDSLASCIRDYYSPQITMDDIKHLVKRLLYGGSLSRWKQLIEAGTIEGEDYVTQPKRLQPGDQIPPMLSMLIAEISMATQIICEVNERALALMGSNGTSEQMDRSAFSKLIQTVENHINYVALQFLRSDECLQSFGFKIEKEFVWSWDGISFIGTEGVDYSLVCEDINQYIVQQCGQEFEVLKYVVKSYANNVITAVLEQVNDVAPEPMQDVDDNFHDPYMFAVETAQTLALKFQNSAVRQLMLESRELEYEDWKVWFQNQYGVFRIQLKSLFGIKAEPGYTYISKAELQNRFIDFAYTTWRKDKGGAMVKEYKKAIDTWIYDSDKNIVLNMDCYPYPTICPPDTVNSWVESPHFNVGYTPVPEALTEYRTLLEIMCGHDPEQTKWLEWWIAHALQRPGEKVGFVPVLMGSEGLGKSFFCNWTSAIIGRAAAVRFEDIVGRFNAILTNKFFIVVNEFPERMDSAQAERFRSVTADIDQIAEDKGMSQFSFRCFTRFMCNCNGKVNVSGRRPNFIQPSATYFGNYEKFEYLSRFLSNKDALCTIYNYYYTLDIQQHFGLEGTYVMPIPETHFNKEHKRNNAIEFGKFLCVMHPTKDSLALTNGQLKFAFRQFAELQGWSDQRMDSYYPSHIIQLMTQHTWKNKTLDRQIFRAVSAMNETNFMAHHRNHPPEGYKREELQTCKLWDLKMMREEVAFLNELANRNVRQRI